MKYILLSTLVIFHIAAFGQQQADSGRTIYIGPFRHGFIDTFSVKENKFRIIAHIESENAGYSFELQKLQSEKWVKQFEFGHGIGMHEPEYDRFTDYNGDGYSDIYGRSRFDNDCFLFDTSKAVYVKCDMGFPYEWKLIDSAHYIFCSLDFNLRDNYGISLLYTFRNFQIYPYYYMKIDDSDDETKKVITLFKCVDGDIDNLKRIMQTEIATDKFDFYIPFWEAAYKKFLGYK